MAGDAKACEDWLRALIEGAEARGEFLSADITDAMDVLLEEREIAELDAKGASFMFGLHS